MDVNDVGPAYPLAICMHPGPGGNLPRSIPGVGNRGLQQLHYMTSLIFVYK